MKMKQIWTIVAASTSLGALSVYASDFYSNYTSIKEKDCTTIETDEVGSVQSCPGIGDIKIQVIDAYARQSITLNRNGTDYPLNFQQTVSPNLSQLGPKMEWRYKKSGKSGHLIALITRLNVSENPNKPNKKTSYLAVSKITSDEICVVGKVPPQSKQNEKARTMAEQSADMSCVSAEISTQENEGRIYFDVKAMKWRDQQGICHTCTKENGFPEPVVQNGFYYDPETKLWRDGNDGAACHTCTPKNGFPTNPEQFGGATVWTQEPTNPTVCTQMKANLASLVPSPLTGKVAAYNEHWSWLTQGADACLIKATKGFVAEQGYEIADAMTAKWQNVGFKYTDGADSHEGTVQVWKTADVHCLLWISYMGDIKDVDSLVVACQ